MSLLNHRLVRLTIALCLTVVLSACGGGDPTPTTGEPTPDAAQPTAQQTADVTPSPTATPDEQQGAAVAPTRTPTPTPIPGGEVVAPTAEQSGCQGLTGQLEVQVLVGPAEAVGMEPVAVGSVPFAVTASEPPYTIEGQAPISYEDVLQQEWGTYAVTMDLDMSVEGECTGSMGSEQLDLVLHMQGEQLVVVDAGGAFHGEYPWEGENSLNLSFPWQEGATAEGEGWVVVLHLGG